jgi:hypothetical protein
MQQQWQRRCRCRCSSSGSGDAGAVAAAAEVQALQRRRTCGAAEQCRALELDYFCTTSAHALNPCTTTAHALHPNTLAHGHAPHCCCAPQVLERADERYPALAKLPESSRPQVCRGLVEPLLPVTTHKGIAVASWL